MSEPSSGSAPASPSLPDSPNLDWLRKQAKRRLDELRETDPTVRLADAQFDLAKRYGFSSWRALKAHVDSLTIDGQLFEATRKGEVDALAALLDRYPEKLHLRTKPYEGSLLHLAASHGQLGAVNLLLRRGLDVNTRDGGDNAYALHFAAGGGYLEVVRRLADAGGDVVGSGDDHALEVIGWATCFDPCHGTVAEFLVARGAQHHIFSAIAMNLAFEVRRLVAADRATLSRRMSRNEDHQLPLHFAVRQDRPEMVVLLLQLGADPLAVDASGYPASAYATSPHIALPIMAEFRALISAELVSAARGHRRPRGGPMDLQATLALGDWETAERLLRENPRLIEPGANAGALHLMAKRGDGAAVRWLLDHGADPNARWSHWDAEVAPLHLAVLGGHGEMVRLLLKAGADPSVRDSRHDGDVLGWAEFFRRHEIVRILEGHAPKG